MIFVKKNRKGLSLVEILIAMLILAIAAAGLFSSFVAANKFISRSKRRLAAVNLARHLNEQLYKDVTASTWIDATSNLLTCPDWKAPIGTLDNDDYPCTKSSDLLDPNFDALLLVPAIDSNSPLDGFTVIAYLDIDLDGADTDCYLNCPRIVKVRIEWAE